MNTNVSFKEKSKLLAAVAVIALVVCAFAVMAPAGNVDAADESPYDDIEPSDFLALADDTGTITLDKSYNLTGSVGLTSDLTLVMNNNSLTTSGDLFILGTDGITLEIVGDENSSIIAGQSNQSSIVWGNYHVGSLIVTGGSYSADYAFVWCGTGENGEVSISDATIDGVTTGPWISYDSNKSLTIDNCEITTGGIGIYCATVQNAQIIDTTVTVEGDDAGSALEIKAGTVDIENSEFYTTGYYLDTAIGQSQSGGSTSAITINNGYTGSAGVDGVTVTIDENTVAEVIRNSSALPVVITNNNSNDISVTWSNHDATSFSLLYGEKAGKITIGDSEVQRIDSIDSIEEAFKNSDVVSFSGTISAEETVTIPADKNLVINDGSTIQGTISIPYETSTATINTTNSSFTINNGAEGTSSVVFTNMTGTVTITYGSVHINGNFTGDLTVTGEVYIGGTITSGEASITADEETTVIADGNITVSAGAILTIEDNVTLDINAYTLTNNGVITGSVTGTGSIVNNGIMVDSQGVANVETYEGLVAAIDDETYGTISINGTIMVPKVIIVDRAVTIIGDNAVLEAIPSEPYYDGDFETGENENKYVISLQPSTADAVIVLQDVTVDSVDSAFGINVWGGDVTLTNVASNNSAGAGFVLGNNAAVEVTGISSDGNIWGGMNVDDGADVTFTDNSLADIGSVYSEDTTDVLITVPEGSATVQMIGKWGTDATTDFLGYYAGIDYVLTQYNDEQNRFNKDGAAIAVNDDTILTEDFTIATGTTVTVAEGKTLTVNDEVTLTVNGTVNGAIENNGKIVLGDKSDSSGATFTGDGTLTSTGTPAAYPLMEEGEIFNNGIRDFVVYHYDNDENVYQYGLAVNTITFNNGPIYNETLSVIPISLHTSADLALTFSATNAIWYDYSSNESYNGYLRPAGQNGVAGFYERVVLYNVTLDSNGLDGVSVTKYLSLTVNKAQSQITASSPNESLTVTQNGNSIVVTGSLAYDDGYTLTIPVSTNMQYYVDGELTSVELLANMFDGATYDPANGLLTIPLGDTVEDSYTFDVDFDGSFDADSTPDNWTTETYTLDLSGLTLSRDVSFSPWEGGSTGVGVGDNPNVTWITIDNTSDLFFGEDTDYPLTFTLGQDNTYAVSGALKYIVGADRYYLPIQIDGLLEGATVNGSTDGINGSTFTMAYRVTDSSTSLTFVVDQGDNYEPETYTLDLTALKLESGVSFANGNDATLADFTEDASVVRDENGLIIVTFSADLKYKANYTDYTTDVTLDSGWFIPWTYSNAIVNGDLTSATATWVYPQGSNVDDKQFAVGLDGSMISKYVYAGDNQFIVDLDGDGDKYIDGTYTVRFDVTCEAVAGYIPFGGEEGRKILNDKYGFNIEEGSNDVGDNTLFIIFNPLANTEYTGSIDYACNSTLGVNAIVGQGQTLSSVTGKAMWYVSLDIDNPSYVGKEGFNTNLDNFGNYLEEFINLAGGVYTLNIDVNGTRYSAEVPVSGIIDAGYSVDATGAESAIRDYGLTANITAENQVIWVIWYNAGTNDPAGTLTLGEDFNENLTFCSDYTTQGLHYAYYAFGDNEIEFDTTYTATIIIDDQSSSKDVLTTDYSSFHVFLDEDVDLYDRNFTVDINKDPLFYVPGTGNPDRTLNYWYLVDAEGEPILDSNGDVQKIKENGLLDFSDLKFEGITGQDIYLKAEYGTSSGGSDNDDQPRQLWDYELVYDYDEDSGSMVVYLVTDKIEGYRNVLTTISLSYSDWETGAGESGVYYYISEPKEMLGDRGIVAKYVFENVDDEGMLRMSAFVGNSWVSIANIDTTPIISEEMTFEIVEAPANAPADNDYPWLQINYQRLYTLDSVQLFVDGVEVTDITWVDGNGQPIEGAPALSAGNAYFQLSISDGEVTEGTHTFSIVATVGGVTQEIEAQYTVTR